MKRFQLHSIPPSHIVMERGEAAGIEALGEGHRAVDRPRGKASLPPLRPRCTPLRGCFETLSRTPGRSGRGRSEAVLKRSSRLRRR